MEIISADSRQIFRYMNIGTDKVPEEVLQKVPHHQINIVDPDQKYSVADFQNAANGLINQYLSMKTLPMICGGTGLYIDALLYGYVIPDLQKESLELRKKLEKLSECAKDTTLKKLLNG